MQHLSQQGPSRRTVLRAGAVSSTQDLRGRTVIVTRASSSTGAATA
jgi:ABC-type nitrate/sulfonate/bicarbonate transport system substrate-binding protein